VQIDFARISEVIRQHHASTGQVLADSDVLESVWTDYRDGEAAPTDPFDGYAYGFVADEESVTVVSSGPDAEAQTDDDIVTTVVF
jgi:hypothetical protein